MSGVSLKSERVVEVSAPAKINLTLEVLGKRPDGYHDLASVMQTLDLADTISLSSAEEVAFSCDLEELRNSDNLVLRAARMLQGETGMEEGVSIRLTKRVPVAAGFGGGSSDAVATLKGLNLLWELGLGEDELWPLACRLGSDVPFFLRGGTAVVGGRGERVRWLPPMHQRWFVVAVPPHQMSNKTAVLYKSLPMSDYTDGYATSRLVDVVSLGGEVDSSYLFNAFEAVAFDIFPHLKEYRARFLDSGAESVHLSGTGPSLYTMVEERQRAETIAKELARRGVKSYVASTLTPSVDLG